MTELEIMLHVRAPSPRSYGERIEVRGSAMPGFSRFALPLIFTFSP